MLEKIWLHTSHLKVSIMVPVLRPPCMRTFIPPGTMAEGVMAAAAAGLTAVAVAAVPAAAAAAAAGAEMK